MITLLADATRWEPWIFILTPLVILAFTAIFAVKWFRQSNRDWTRVGGGVVRLKVTGGWLLRREWLFSMREPMTFVPDPQHENPPQLIPE